MAEKKATKSGAPPRAGQNRMAPSTRADRASAQSARRRLKLVGPEHEAPVRPRIGGVHLSIAGNTMAFYTGREVELSEEEYEEALATELPGGFSWEGVKVNKDSPPASGPEIDSQLGVPDVPSQPTDATPEGEGQGEADNS